MIRRTLAATQAATFSVDLPGPPATMGLPTPSGTGFFVSPEGWFVTAAHVVTENGRPDGTVRLDIDKAILMKEDRWPDPDPAPMCTGVSVELVDPATDFALLKVDFAANAQQDAFVGKTGFPHIEVSTRELEEGEPVYAFGYPLPEIHDPSTLPGSPVSFNPAIVSAVAYTVYCPRVTSAIVSSTLEKTKFISTTDDPKVYVLDKALNYGNSGGPILAVETGKVYALCSRFQPVGIPQHHLPGPQGRPIVVSIPSLYGVVSSLANPSILQALRDRGIPLSDE